MKKAILVAASVLGGNVFGQQQIAVFGKGEFLLLNPPPVAPATAGPATTAPAFPAPAPDTRQAGTSAATATTAPAPLDAAKLAFLAAFQRDLAGTGALEASLPVENPPEWGRVVSDQSGGTLRYHRAFAGGFVCHLTLGHLLPSHRYILTLNGNPEKQGNNLLPDPVPGYEAERFYDFLGIDTDAAGRYDAALGIFLTPAPYDVRLYVKDTADFKIVLYRDFFRFTVE